MTNMSMLPTSNEKLPQTNYALMKLIQIEKAKSKKESIVKKLKVDSLGDIDDLDLEEQMLMNGVETLLIKILLKFDPIAKLR
jgi:hypothetical protein